MSIDNLNIIKPLLKFDNENEFYFLQIIQRKKDMRDIGEELKGNNNSSRLIKAYYIYSIESLDKQYGEIVKLCKLFDARACINLNKRNAYDMGLAIMARIAENIKNKHVTQLHRIYNTVCGEHNHDSDKSWIIDIDHKNRREINEVIVFTDKLDPVGFKMKAMIESKSGFHIITSPFHLTNFKERYPDIDVHKNNPTNLYIP